MNKYFLIEIHLDSRIGWSCLGTRASMIGLGNSVAFFLLEFLIFKVCVLLLTDTFLAYI